MTVGPVRDELSPNVWLREGCVRFGGGGREKNIEMDTAK